ncbi:MAG TPA: helix-turn-helix domain-containing protein [Solirubrobacteraceae bacterium]|jgi:AcrR family transcriptional regulator|nr:helix-turn-helix domain-containing protein [Solirubrobacteraceae bacterium]
MATSVEPDRPLRADARRNREKIVNAARKIVAEQGEAAQIDDVARLAGVGVGTVYRHFPNKDALMGELVRGNVVECTGVARDCASVDDPWDAFAAMVRRSCERGASDAAFRRTWQAAAPEAEAYAADVKLELMAAAGALIERAHAAGVLREDFTVQDMPGLMCGLGAAIDAMPEGDRWRRLVEFALDGLRAR